MIREPRDRNLYDSHQWEPFDHNSCWFLHVPSITLFKNVVTWELISRNSRCQVGERQKKWTIRTKEGTCFAPNTRRPHKSFTREEMLSTQSPPMFFCSFESCVQILLESQDLFFFSLTRNITSWLAGKREKQAIIHYRCQELVWKWRPNICHRSMDLLAYRREMAWKQDLQKLQSLSTRTALFSHFLLSLYSKEMSGRYQVPTKHIFQCQPSLSRISLPPLWL